MFFHPCLSVQPTGQGNVFLISAVPKDFVKDSTNRKPYEIIDTNLPSHSLFDSNIEGRSFHPIPIQPMDEAVFCYSLFQACMVFCFFSTFAFAVWILSFNVSSFIKFTSPFNVWVMCFGRLSFYLMTTV